MCHDGKSGSALGDGFGGEVGFVECCITDRGMMRMSVE